MATAGASLEGLIQKATNPLNLEDDPNAIQAVCQAVNNEGGNVQTAVRLIAHKIQSPQERESMQALSVLQACANNCGLPFHAEIGKFRFLNEMIKLVSPKYLGNHTSSALKKRVIELLYTWTVDLKSEAKILEAYNMLKKQGVVKEDPAYIGAPSLAPRPKANAVFEDEEKSRLLQRLLQSKNPEDLHKANALIKSMVKEDERRMERTSRRIVEVETAMNNVRVLDDMLTQHQESSASSADLDLMAELHTSCCNLRSRIYRLVSEMDDKEDGIGELLKANDELSRVMGRYKLIVEGAKMEKSETGESSDTEESQKVPSKDSDHDSGGEMLLDLATPEEPPKETASDALVNSDLKDLGLDGLKIGALDSEIPQTTGSSLLDDLATNFPSASAPVAPHPLGTSGSTPFPAAAMVAPILPQATLPPSSPKIGESKNNPLDELDVLSVNLMKKNLPANASITAQFKAQEKMSMNQMKQQQTTTAPTVSAPVGSVAPSLPLGNQCLDILGGLDSTSTGLNGDTVKNLSNPLSNLDFLVTGSAEPSSCVSHNENSHQPSLLDDNSIIDGFNHEPVKEVESAKVEPQLDVVKSEKEVHEHISESSGKAKDLEDGQSTLKEVKPMSNIKVTLESIKPGSQESIKVLDSNEVSVTIHFTENKPREDVSVLVVSTMSRNPNPIHNYVLQAVVPKGCKVRLQAPSGTELAAFSPFLPAPAVTQIMLIANPNMLTVTLKVMLSYTLEDDLVSEMGEIAALPL
ncbi:ADP-ribosylation factor-binding protein Gga isoform X3 [Oratosquilla oratoria]|uniref:ADP-ribosylation factor-binding protein Gga isoform X3 n=1 Tax=Oratosquilla oratoria TaxID=337810 RepID=UPI003F766403